MSEHDEQDVTTGHSGPWRAGDLELVPPSALRAGDLLTFAGPAAGPAGVFGARRVASCRVAGYTDRLASYRVELAGARGLGPVELVRPESLHVLRVTTAARAAAGCGDVGGRAA